VQLEDVVMQKEPVALAGTTQLVDPAVPGQTPPTSVELLQKVNDEPVMVATPDSLICPVT
jgi:hypothetical protein